VTGKTHHPATRRNQRPSRYAVDVCDRPAKSTFIDDKMVDRSALLSPQHLGSLQVSLMQMSRTMSFPTFKQVVTVLVLLAGATSLSGCGCGPLGLNYCGGGRGGGHHYYGGGYYGGGGGYGR